MKKRALSLLLALVMALALFPAAGAAGNTNPLQVTGLAQGQTGFLAGYNDQGRMVGLRMLTANGQVAAIPGATTMKLIRTDSGYAPQGQAFSLSQSSGTVRKVDGQVRLCYDGPNGLTVSQAVTEKITGKVSLLNTKGLLYINGQWYSATELTVEGCVLPISADGFMHWPETVGLPTCDFYLDGEGNICWADQLSDGTSRVCVVLAAYAQGDAILVKLFASNKTSLATVNQLNGKPISDVSAALTQLNSIVRNKFCVFQQLAGGIGSLTLLENDPAWQSQVDIPQGTDIARHFDFTGGAIGLTADGDTRFLVVTNYSTRQEFSSTNAYSEIPLPHERSVRGFAIARADDPGVADYVYLEYGEYIQHPYTPCFIPSSSCGSDPSDPEDVFRTRAVDANGSDQTIKVTYGIKEAISQDSMEVGKYGDNTYVGKLCVITEQRADRAVLALAPTEVYPLLSLENGTITTQTGTWIYDEFTQFVWVNMGWTDENGNGVRDAGDSVKYGSSQSYGYSAPSCPAETCEEKGLRVAVLSEEGTEEYADYVYIISGLR